MDQRPTRPKATFLQQVMRTTTAKQTQDEAAAAVPAPLSLREATDLEARLIRLEEMLDETHQRLDKLRILDRASIADQARAEMPATIDARLDTVLSRVESLEKTVHRTEEHLERVYDRAAGAMRSFEDKLLATRRDVTLLLGALVLAILVMLIIIFVR